MDNDINVFDSNEELLFNNWLTFLKDKGYINSFYKNDNDVIEITPKQEYCNKKCNFLLHPWTYKYDFRIDWNNKAKDLLFDEFSGNCYFKAVNNVSYIDIKGMFTRRNRITDITFPLVQKALYHFKSIYIQKVIPLKLFKKLFAHDEYLKNDNIYKVGIKKGSIKHKLKSFNEFLNGRKHKRTNSN